MSSEPGDPPIEEPKRFGLSRSRLYLDPRDPEQAKIYVGRDKILERVEDRITGCSVPNVGDALRMVFFGDYGSGKTHSLFKTAQMIKEKGIRSKSIHSVGDEVGLYVKISDPIRVTFADIYKDIVNDAIGKIEIEKWIYDFYVKMEDKFELRSRDTTETNKVEKITQFLRSETSYQTEELVKLIVERVKLETNTPKSNLIWKWIAGHTCTAGEKTELGVNEDNSNPNVAMRNLISIIEIFNIGHPDEILLFMFDEMEKLSTVQPAKMGSYEESFRNLIEQEVDAGIIFATTAKNYKDNNSIFKKAAIKSRLGANTYELTTFGTSGSGNDPITWFKKFLAKSRPDGDDWKQYVKAAQEAHGENYDRGITEELFPFTKDAVDQAITNLSSAEGGAIAQTPRTVLGSFVKAMAISLGRDSKRKIFDKAGFI